MTADDLTEEERALLGAYDVAADLAKRCSHLHALMRASGKGNALRDVMNTLMTELWDQRFSQTEIREAFTATLTDMSRYTGGRERRG